MSRPDIDWSLPFAHGVVLLLGVTLYALLAGADFGGGVWDLLARGDRAKGQRDAIAHAIGPVWEANHVWLIFVIVVVFTAFPPVFAALSTALYVPFTLALLGIVFRGAAFIFRSQAIGAVRIQASWGRVFAMASAFTPFLLGMAAGAVASGQIRVIDGDVTSGLWRPWLSLFPAVIGALALATCAYLAAVYLTLETSGALQEDFRVRALGAGLAFAGLSAIALPLTHERAPVVWHGLTHEALLVVPLATAAVALSGWAVWTRRYRLARPAAAAAVAVILVGWALAQEPYLVVPDLTYREAAAPAATLKALLVVLGIGGLFLIPALWFLFAVFKRGGPVEPADAAGD